ncbi:uncharacterized protein C8R40DRAFT_203124 [Lentinula edodes]|uniref:uncharacterized protein n=1 Tax=Lentinula edodes TaxID=5353 RepID=UPI001E8CDBEE|nr:uncharacterized protein C8R40DRAFT_203124 [Lentinula edodes]KAH7875383.1 hypothetical protein C8R40DRAFT_203124 [Lentinula edodes]
MQSARSHIPKAPVYNPYDKFPQTDFDAWIGGITGTLRKVLRHEEEPEPQPQEEKWYYRIGDEEGPQINGYGGKETDGESSGEEQLDDSFAAMRARRVKGKARDPREGPGLAAGTINEPIELGSEDEGSDEGVGLDVGSDDEELDEEEKYYDSEGEDDPEYERDSARASHRSTRSPTPSRRRRTVVEDPAEEEEDKDEEGQRSSQGGPEEIEDEQEEEEVSGEISTEDSVNTHARPYDLEDEDGDCFGSPLRPLTFENEHAHRRNSPEDDRQEIHDVDEEEQPVSENTAFPLDAEQDELYSSQPLSLPDIWEGPQTYAEDYYSGGDVMHDSVFPLSADALNEHDVNEKASDSGFFLTPGLLTPNGFNVSSPAASDEEQVAVPSSKEKTKSPQLLQDIHDENGKAYNERSNSPLPGSSPLPMSPEFDPEDQYVNNQPSPVYILSDEEEQEQNQFDMREERSSPPPEYEIDDEVDATPDNDYQDVFADTDADVLAADTVIPLGTSDLDIIDEVDVEAENATIYENELSIEEDKLPALEDPVASLQEDGQDNACLKEDAQQNSFALKEPLDDVTNPLEMEAGEALVGLQKTISPLPKPISIPSIETTSRPDLETDSQNINEADVEMVSQSVEIEADVSHSSPLLIGTDVGIAVTVQDIESEETPELMYPEDGDVYSVVSVISEEQDELDEDGEYDLDVESIPGTDVVINLYEVEEILTEGRLTIEPEINDSDEGDGFLNVQNVSEHFVTEEFTQDSNDAGPSSEDAPEAPDASVESKLSTDVLTGPEGLSQIGSPSATEVIASTTDNEIRAAPVSADDLPQILSPSDRSSASQTAHDAEIASVPVNEPLPVSEMLDVSASGPGTPQPSLPLLSPAESSHALGDNTSVNDIIDARKHDLGVSTTPDIVQVLDHEKSSVQSIAATISETPALGSQTELSTISSDADDISTTHALAPGTIEEKSFGPPVQLPDTFIAELLTRKGIPVLHADPYPASLSTPTDEAEDGSVTDDEVDEIDQDSIISTEVSSSNSSLEEDKSLTISSELPVQTANEELDETGEDMDMDLQYPPSDEEKTAPASSSGIAHTVADELDFDAEGDIDPDFVESHDVATSGMHIQDDSQVTTEQILAEHTAEPFISSSIPTASQVADIDSHHGIPIYPSVELEENQSEDLPPEIRADIDDAAARISEPVELVTADINDELVRSDVVESQSELPSAAAPVLTDSTEFASAHVFSSEKPKEKMEEEAIIAQAVNDGSKESMASAAEEPIGKSESSPPTQDLPSIPPVTDDVDPNRSLSHDTKSPDTGTTRRTKRKRKTPITLRNGSSAALAKDNNIPIISKGKGKKTVVPQDISDTTSTSGASTAAQFLTGSRASSIVSTSTGDGSGQHNPSPTPHRVKDSSPSSTRFAAPPLPPPPPPLPQLMFHNHSKNKAAPIRRPALSVQTELPRAVSRAPSLSQPLAVSSSQAHSPDVGTPDSRSVTPAPSQSPHILRREPSSNSPVTRSHCRYHKISLPEEEDGGTHIFFLVPGCSLVDRKLIKEEEIVDHGDATYDDSIRKVADIETLGINEYVIGVIRMLVGPDKEHEVYFMPKPGEERARKVIHRKSRLRSSISSSASLHSPRTSISNINGNLLSPSSSSVAPVSAAGSSSTNRSSKQWRRQHDREKEADSSLWSEAYSTETDGEESDGEYKGPSKKPKLVHPTDVAETSSQNSHKSLSQGSTQLRESASAGPGPRNKTKRKRPLDPSAAEYKPHEDEGNESFDEALVKPKKNALKRARTSEPNPSTTSKEPERKRKKKTLKMVPYGFHH